MNSKSNRKKRQHAIFNNEQDPKSLDSVEGDQILMIGIRCFQSIGN